MKTVLDEDGIIERSGGMRLRIVDDAYGGWELARQRELVRRTKADIDAVEVSCRCAGGRLPFALIGEIEFPNRRNQRCPMRCRSRIRRWPAECFGLDRLTTLVSS